MRKFAKLLLAIIGISILAMIFSSCVTYQKCIDKFGKVSTDSVEKAFKIPVQIIVPGDSSEVGISLDSLCMIWQAQTAQYYTDSLGKVHRFYNQQILKVSNSGKTELSYWIDRYNRVLRMKATAKTDTVEKTVEGVVRCPPLVVVSPDNERTVWKQFQLFAAWVVIAGLAFALIYMWFKR